MVGNVFFIIIPNQNIVVRDLIAGRTCRSPAGRGGEAALAAQQLPDAAGRVRDAEQPLCVHLYDALELAGAGGRVHREFPGAALVQHQAHGRQAGLAAVAGGGGADGAGGRADGGRAAACGGRRGHGDVRAGAADRRDALRRPATPPARPSRGIAEAPKGIMLDTAGPHRATGAADLSAGGGDADDAAGQRDRDHRRRSVPQLAKWVQSGAPGP